MGEQLPGGEERRPPNNKLPNPHPIENQGNPEHRAILPSYFDSSARRLQSKWLEPTKDKELLKGWDSLAEYLLDQADIIDKPISPNIPKDDIDAIDEDNQLAHGMTADEWEEQVIFQLKAAEDTHLIRQFKEDMQEYRKAVKSIVQLWREKGML